MQDEIVNHLLLDSSSLKQEGIDIFGHVEKGLFPKTNL